MLPVAGIAGSHTYQVTIIVSLGRHSMTEHKIRELEVVW